MKNNIVYIITTRKDKCNKILRHSITIVCHSLGELINRVELLKKENINFLVKTIRYRDEK